MRAIIIIIFTVNLCYSQFTTTDWKAHNAGNVFQVQTNLWSQGYCHIMPLGPAQTHTLYPKNSTNQYTKWDENNGVEPSIGAKIGSPLAPVHVSSGGHENGYEFYATTEPWDTIWVVNRGETPNIPYLPNYVGLSDQDFVFRVADNNRDENGELVYIESGWTNPHVTPLGLEVVQTSHAWSSAPLDEFILYQSYVTPKGNNLYDVYAGFWWGGQIGLLPQPSFDDDCTMYDAERYFSIAYDTDGVPEDNVPGPIGFKMFPPEIRNSSGRQVLDPESLNWTWNNFYDVPYKTDQDKYQIMSSHIINQDGCDNVRIGPMWYWFFGPLDSLVIGDTLKMTWGEVLGEGFDGVYQNLQVMEWMYENEFQSPSPPPRPTVTYSVDNHSVTLDWSITADAVNPETWVDPIRLDQLVESQPFEGYRVYKSSNHQGPWTLLSEYDIADNEFYNDYGLEYTYTDDGLLNNIEYYYSVTSFSKPDKVSFYPSTESSIDMNAIEVIAGTGSPETVGKVAVVPNPYRGDEYYNEYNPPWERSSYLGTWMEQDRRIQFINLPSPSTIKVYTLSGDEVYSLNHNNPDKGYEDWNLTSSVGQTIASGIYLFTVEDLKNGDIQTGKFVVVK